MTIEKSFWRHWSGSGNFQEKGDWMKISINNEGFTFLEILLVILIIAIVIPVIFNINMSGWRIWFFNQDRIEFQRAHRVIDLTVGKYARKAYFINDNYGVNGELKLIYAGDSIVFGQNDDGYFYYAKDSGVSRTFSTFRINAISYNYSQSDKILTFSITLTDGEQEYSFTDKYFPRLYKLIIP